MACSSHKKLTATSGSAAQHRLRVALTIWILGGACCHRYASEPIASERSRLATNRASSASGEQI